MPRRTRPPRMSVAAHEERLRYWRDYYRRNRSALFHRPGKTAVRHRIEHSFREATPRYERVIQSRHRTVRRKGEIERLRLSIAGKRRTIPTKERALMLLGTRRSAQLKRGSRKRKGI